MLKDVRTTAISSYSEDKVSINLTEGDLEKFQRLFAGVSRLSIINGEVVEDSVFLHPPTPTEDPIVEPHWPQIERRVRVQTAISFPKELSEHATPSIIISHLCGYNWTPEKYQLMANRLESWGFACLRSRRQEEGKYWEQWVLSGLWGAMGDLKKIVDSEDDPFYDAKVAKERREWERPMRKRKQLRDKNGKLTNLQRLRNVVEYLRRNAEFGTLDVTVQKLAMVMRD